MSLVGIQAGKKRGRGGRLQYNGGEQEEVHLTELRT